ncbi:MAG: sucrose-6-phosphate hydrolase [Frankia sp.]|nr:sucrose-6-phosphate hydrolase [Frankia sp.]
MAAGPRSEGGGGWLVACDLDQTLIFSRRSFRLPAGVPEPPLSTAEHIDGEPAAFLTVAAAERLAALDRLATLVPVTTRTLAQYRRVDLGVRPRYAIAANGGHLLVGGQPDQDWAAEVAGRLAATSAPLAEAAAIAEELAAGGWTRLTRVADDLFVYLVAHHRDGIPDLGPASARLAALGYTVSVQGRKVYLVPTGLTKGAALAEVVRRAGTSHLAAAGDSLLDAPMLAGADVAIRPAHGELHDRGWTLPGLRVTAAAGLLAGEELAASLVDLVSPAPAAATPWPAAGAGAARARLA